MAQRKQDLTPDQQTTLDKLKAQEHVPILIPRDPLNPKDKVAIVGVNGVVYAIPRGKQFSVPAAIAKVWHKSYEKTQAAYERIRISEMGDDDREIEIRR